MIAWFTIESDVLAPEEPGEPQEPTTGEFSCPVNGPAVLPRTGEHPVIAATGSE